MIENKKDQHQAWDAINGNETAKRALEIAAAGGHNILLMGTRETDKETFARALADILPSMTEDEKAETEKIYSEAGLATETPAGRPFRMIFPGVSISSLFGGGAGHHPGELRLANNGILCLADYAMMPKTLAESLRGPLEDKKVVMLRIKGTTIYPTKFRLIILCEPCPCGHYGDGDRCICTTHQRAAYLSRIGGPLIDATTLQAWVHNESDASGQTGKEPCSAVAERVIRAMDIQMRRQKKLNDELCAREIETHCRLDEDCRKTIETIIDRLGLSVMAYTRILKTARTIADLDGVEDILPHHLAEAASYRFLDRRIN